MSTPPSTLFSSNLTLPIPVAEWSKVSVCGSSLAGTEGSNPAGEYMFVLCVCCTVRTKRPNAEQSGQRSTDKVQKEKEESRYSD